MNAMPVRRLANVALLAVGIGGMLLFVVGASRSDRPTGPRWPTYLEEVATAEEAFALLGQQAFVLRLVGGPARCWVDVTSDGRTKHYDSIGSRVLDALTAEQLESYRNMYREHRFVFVLQEPDEAGVERWMLAEEMGCCRDEPLPAGSPIGFRLRRWLYLVRPQIVIMNGGGSGGQESPIGRDLTTLRSRTSAHTHLPNPLPPGEDVVVATIDKEGRDSPESVVHRRAYAITCRAGEP